MNLKYLIISLVTFLLYSCDDITDNDDNNPCLQDKSINFVINLNLPLYSDLEFSGNDLIIEDRVNFIEGIYIRRDGNFFTVLELSEPNDCIDNCGIPELSSTGFFEYDCGDETTKYNAGGFKVDVDTDDFNMRAYNTSFSENRLTITY